MTVICNSVLDVIFKAYRHGRMDQWTMNIHDSIHPIHVSKQPVLCIHVNLTYTNQVKCSKKKHFSSRKTFM